MDHPAAYLGPFLIIAANHASFLDPPFVGCHLCRARSPTSRARRLWKPGVAACWLDAVGTIPVDRDGSDVSAIKARAARAAGRVARSWCFPEGTRSPDGCLAAAEGRWRGTAWIACRAQVPVVPTRIFNSHLALGRTGPPRLGTPVSVVYGNRLGSLPADYDDPATGKERYQRANETHHGRHRRAGAARTASDLNRRGVRTPRLHFGARPPHARPQAWRARARTWLAVARACAVAQDAFDIIGIRRQFGAARTRGGEIIPIVFEQHLLEVAVAEAAGAEPVPEICATSAGAKSSRNWIARFWPASELGLGRRAAVPSPGPMIFPQAAFSSPKSRWCCRSSCSFFGRRGRATGAVVADLRLGNQQRSRHRSG